MPLGPASASLYITPRPLPQRRQSSYSRYKIIPYPSPSTTSILHTSCSSLTTDSRFGEAPRLRPSPSNSRQKRSIQKRFRKFFTMSFAFCRGRQPTPNAPKRQRSKLRRASGPRKIGAPTDLKINPMPNPGEPGFQNRYGGVVKINETAHGVTARQDLVPIEEVQKLRPISLSFLTARDSDPTALGNICGIMDAITGSSRAASVYSADGRTKEIAERPPMPTREAPRPPRDNVIHGARELRPSLAIVIPESARAKVALDPEHPVRQDLEQRYSNRRAIYISHPESSSAKQSSSSSSKSAPAVIQATGATAKVAQEDPSPLDPHAVELYQGYQRTGEIYYCIPESALDENNKYTWQHCSSLLNAYIHGVALNDVEFADRVMDILDQQIARGVCVDPDTIRHLFTSYSTPEQLKLFVVNRCVDSGAKNFRREQTRRLPKLYLLTVLETVMERLASGLRPHSSLFTACEYHLHGNSRRCYKMVKAARKREMEAEKQKGRVRRWSNTVESSNAEVSERESDISIGTAEVVRLVKVHGKSADNLTINSSADSFKTVGEIEIKRKKSGASRVLRKGEGTSPDSSEPEEDPSRHDPSPSVRPTVISVQTRLGSENTDMPTVGDESKEANSAAVMIMNDEASDPATLISTKSHISSRERMLTDGMDSGRPSLRSQHSSSSDTSVYTTTETTLDTIPSLEFPSSVLETLPGGGDAMSSVMTRRVASEVSLFEVFALPGAFPSSVIVT
ncbi:hypothetical protein K458DRAFT_400976 [Lentithecium fluviatile CBS 122367]|uniref:Uncharacterized protein n=1 Tax=Lentithecium fluviatile CBS 122367 TaxID=1168545 RepID=A0A6G1JFE8_9PLEO|nr:hypothetical protein K458DRAFT_400976 [Lentithecium fluviatile CBS 122367]